MSTQGPLCAKLHSVFDPLHQELGSLQQMLSDYTKMPRGSITSVMRRGAENLSIKKEDFFENVYKPEVFTLLSQWWPTELQEPHNPSNSNRFDFEKFKKGITFDEDGRIVYNSSLLLEVTDAYLHRRREGEKWPWFSLIKRITGTFIPSELMRNFKGLEKVDGTLSLKGSGLVTAEDLEETQDLSLMNSPSISISMPRLKRIHGRLKIDTSCKKIKEFSVPALKEIPGDADFRNVEEFEMGELEKIDGAMYLPNLSISFRQAFPKLKQIGHTQLPIGMEIWRTSGTRITRSRQNVDVSILVPGLSSQLYHEVEDLIKSGSLQVSGKLHIH